MYEVLITFTDPEHRRVYYAGDIYPGRGHKATAERIEYLAGDTNRFGEPVIGLIGAPVVTPPVEPPVEPETAPVELAEAESAVEPAPAPEAPTKPAKTAKK